MEKENQGGMVITMGQENNLTSCVLIGPEDGKMGVRKATEELVVVKTGDHKGVMSLHDCGPPTVMETRIYKGRVSV